MSVLNCFPLCLLWCSRHRRPSMLYLAGRGSHRVKQISVPALVDQRTEPTVLHFQEFIGLVEFDLLYGIYFSSPRKVGEGKTHNSTCVQDHLFFFLKLVFTGWGEAG